MNSVVLKGMGVGKTLLFFSLCMSKLNKSKMGGPTDTSCSVSSAWSSCAVVSSISKPFRDVTLGSLSCEIYLKVGHLLLHAENLSPDRLTCHQSVTHIFQIKTIWQSHGLPICQSFFFHKMIVPLVNVFATSKSTLPHASVKRTEKLHFFFLQVPSEPKPILHLVCAVRPQPAAQLGARPKVFFSCYLF